MHKIYFFLLSILVCHTGCKLGDYYSGFENLSKGTQWLAEHQYDSAEYYFRKNLHLEGEFNSYIYLAQVKALKGERNFAQRFIDSADFKRTDFNADYLNNRGYVQNLIGDYNAALMSLAAAVELDPEMAYAHSNLGRTYFKLQEEDLAHKHLKKAMALDPEDPYPYHNFGLLLESKGDLSSACQYLEIAIQKNSSFILPIGPELKYDHKRICQ